MSKPVLFAGTRPYGRAENISALYDAYQGEKKYIEVSGKNIHEDMKSGEFDVLVIDDFPSVSPGKCIMIWHAIQGGKHIGFDQNYPYLNEDRAKQIDYVIAAGHGAVPMWSQCMHMPEDRILPLGMPRTDQYIGKKKGDGHTVLAGKRAYLFVPTFRWLGEPNPIMLDYDWLDEQLYDDEILAVKSHMAGYSILDKRYKHIIELPKMAPSAPYLYDCDVVITDYSSIIFDGYLLNKPSVLIEKQKGYVDTRGMYMQYPKQYSSYMAHNEQTLLDYIRRARYEHDLAPMLGDIENRCMKRVADMCDGHSCERICNLIDLMNGE